MGFFNLVLVEWGKHVVCCGILFLCICSGGVYAQETITGTVTNAQTGEPIADVNIVVRETNLGTSTNAEGYYSLQVPSLQDTLVFSFVGYKSKVVPIKGRTEINVQLQSTTIMAEELVVVGYGKQKKKHLVGAVAQVDIEDISTRPAADVATTLQGTIPGLNIRPASGGDPSETPEINIRGFTSLNGGSPLVLIDGIKGNISNINPNDIKSVTVLKGAEAAAIYGARAAFGVVLITTKSGSAEPIHIEYSNNIGFSTNTTRTDFITSPYRFAKIVDGANRAYRNECYICYDEEDYKIAKKVATGKIEPFYEKQPDGTYEFYFKNDVYHMIFRRWRPHQMHNISISGGTEKLNAYFSGRIYKRTKIQNIQEANMRRYNLKFNINFKPYDWLRVSASSRYSQKFDEVWGGKTSGWAPIYSGSRWRDAFPVFPYKINGYGVSVGRTGTGYSARLASLYSGAGHRQWKYRKIVNTIESNVTPVKGLELNMQYSYSVNRVQQKYRMHKFKYMRGNRLILTTGGLNRLSEWRWRDIYKALNIYGSYEINVANKHNFKLMMGFNQEQFDHDRIGARTEGLITKDKANFNLATGMLSIDGTTTRWAIQGYFARFNYNYKEKYFLESNIRYDGSSRFPENNRWGLFPSIGVAWRVDKEVFWPSSVGNVISSLKLRAAYGRLGNQSVGVNTFRKLVRTGKTNWMDANFNELTYARVPEPLPAQIGWEEITSTNIGVDIGLFEEKLQVTFNLYQRVTSNMYLPGKPLPAVFGASEPRRSYASLRNRGFELSIKYQDQFNVMGSKLFLSLGANVYNNKAVITKFDNPNGLMSTYWEGQILGTIWGYHIAGQFQSDKEAATYQHKFGVDNLIEVYRSALGATSNAEWSRLRAGDIIYVDTNGDGEIDNGNNTLEDHGDLVRIGNSMPKFPFGFNINAKWKQFDISIIGQGVVHQDFYPAGPLYWGTYHRPYVAFLRKDLYAKAWDPNASDNSGNIFPQRQRAYMALNDGRSLYELNDYYLLNIGYLRINNITFGYTLPPKLTQRVNIKNLRIYVSAENVFTFRFGNLTEYLDPEVLSAASIDYANPDDINPNGLDNDQLYPMPKTYSFGIQITF